MSGFASGTSAMPHSSSSNETPTLENSSGSMPSDLHQFVGPNGVPLITDPAFRGQLAAFLASHAIAQKSPEVAETPMRVNKVVMNKEVKKEVEDFQEDPKSPVMANEVVMSKESGVEVKKEVEDFQEDPMAEIVKLRKKTLEALRGRRQEFHFLGELVAEKLAELESQDKKTLESLSNDLFEALVKHRCV